MHINESVMGIGTWDEVMMRSKVSECDNARSNPIDALGWVIFKIWSIDVCRRNKGENVTNSSVREEVSESGRPSIRWVYQILRQLLGRLWIECFMFGSQMGSQSEHSCCIDEHQHVHLIFYSVQDFVKKVLELSSEDDSTKGLLFYYNGDVECGTIFIFFIMFTFAFFQQTKKDF